MVGYVRNDTSNNIADGNIINASDFDGEFDAIQSAFSSATGHKHDGTAANGAPIEVVGPTQDVTISASQTRPKTTNTHDLGSDLLRFRSLYLSALADITDLKVSGTVQSDLRPDATGTRSLGRLTSRWFDLYADNLYGATLELTSGVNTNLNPTTHNTRDLGTNLVRWRSLYVGTDVITNHLTLSGTVKSNLTGNATNTYDLGTSVTRWKDLFLSGGASINGFVTGTAVTQTNVDSTSGRLLKVGDYGLGGILPIIGNCAVVDNSIVPSDYSYRTAAGSSGGPVGITTGVLSHRRRTAGGGETQTLVSESATLPRSFTRSRDTGAWSTWDEQLYRRDMVGGVSPTYGAGAIFERWDDMPNERSYTIFGDGTLIFHDKVTTSAAGPTTVSMPLTPSASFPVSVLATHRNYAAGFVYADYIGSGDVEVAAWNSAGALAVRGLYITVIGRMF